MRRFGKRSSDGRGIAVCDRSGMVCDASQRIRDVRGGWVRPEDADLTPGFGTWHPRDHPRVGRLDDPKPIRNARTDAAEIAEPDDSWAPPHTAGGRAA